MNSPAALKYQTAANRAQTLRKAATDRRLRPMPRDEKQVYYHAALAAYVAAWDAYINNLVRDFYDAIADPLDTKFHAIYTVAQQLAERSLNRFNTPNWENTRNLLILGTKYDPIHDWIWARSGMGVVDVRHRLNQILRVRHSFAHGFGMPAYSWNQSPSGRVRLTSNALQNIEAFFKHLVYVTDRGMKLHIESTYGISTGW
jgi:hypothetical protein